jgi:hypothetical protein
MKKTKNNNPKKEYSNPQVERIDLDNDISLVLDSTPPLGPGETSLSPEYLKKDPFKSTMA